MKYLLPFVLSAGFPLVLGSGYFSHDSLSIYGRDWLDSDHGSDLGARTAELHSYGDIRAWYADSNDDFMRQQLELQQRLQEVANDPEEAQKVQQQQLDLMKKQPEKMNGGQNQKRQIERRSMHARATAEQQQRQMIAEQQKQIAQQQMRDKAAQRKQWEQQADAIARTPGAGIGAGATIEKIVPGINARALLRRMAEALAEAENED